MKLAPISAAALLATLTLSVQLASAQGRPGGTEQTLLQLANRDRAAQGLAPLKWSASLAEAARDHALRLAQQNTLSHQLPGEAGLADRATRTGARFSSIAENVAEGPSAERIHELWMHSAPHRANLLDAQLDSMGVAIADRNGTLFAVEDFSLAVDDVSIHQQERLVEGQLQKLGLRLLAYADDARRSCVLDNGFAGSHRPSFVVHYATPDLQTLPGMLEQRIRTGKYHSAAVGACPSDGKFGFSSHRVAVLLFE
jgi:Cysteine-rich secretory protein family